MLVSKPFLGGPDLGNVGLGLDLSRTGLDVISIPKAIQSSQLKGNDPIDSRKTERD
jgi:hypothetical protein